MFIPGFPIPVVPASVGVNFPMATMIAGNLEDVAFGFVRSGSGFSTTNGDIAFGALDGTLFEGLAVDAVYSGEGLVVVFGGNHAATLAGVSGLLIGATEYPIFETPEYDADTLSTFIYFNTLFDFEDSETYTLQLT